MTQQLDLSDLPEPVAGAIAAMVQAVRQQLHAVPPKKDPKDLPRWDGQVIGSLSREEIYEDAV